MMVLVLSDTGRWILMDDKFDDPSNSDLRTKLFREGKVVLLQDIVLHYLEA